MEDFKLKIDEDGKLILTEKSKFDTLIEGIWSDLGNTLVQPLDKLGKGFITDSPEAEKATDAKVNFEFDAGGSITFSTKVTSNPYDKYKNTPEDDVGKRTGFNLKNHFYSLLNKINKNSKINQIILKVAKKAKEEGINLEIGFSLSGKNTGSWVDLVSKQAQVEPSYVLTFEGFPIKIIEEIALEMMNVFKQQSVIIKDFANNKRYVLDAVRHRKSM